MRTAPLFDPHSACYFLYAQVPSTQLWDRKEFKGNLRVGSATSFFRVGSTFLFCERIVLAPLLLTIDLIADLAITDLVITAYFCLLLCCDFRGKVFSRLPLNSLFPDGHGHAIPRGNSYTTTGEGGSWRLLERCWWFRQEIISDWVDNLIVTE